MKKICILAVVLVLSLAAMAGCGCRRNPGTVPTDNATMNPTTAITEAPTTSATEEATTAATDNTSVPDETIDMIPGGMDPDNNTTGTDATVEGNARNRSMNRK